MITRKYTSGKMIPLTSMADIAFILLIFFILTSTIDMDRSIPVNLPESEISYGGSYKFFHVWISSSGEMFLRGEKKDAEEIFQFAKYRAMDNPDVKGLIGADRDVPFVKINSVMEILRNSGVCNIVLLTKKRHD